MQTIFYCIMPLTERYLLDSWQTAHGKESLWQSVDKKILKQEIITVRQSKIRKLIPFLRLRMKIIARNPFPHANKPKTNYKKRDIWTADLIRKALDECDDMKLYAAMNLAFACSMRYEEICGLTWDKVHISDEDIANDASQPLD